MEYLRGLRWIFKLKKFYCLSTTVLIFILTIYTIFSFIFIVSNVNRKKVSNLQWMYIYTPINTFKIYTHRPLRHPPPYKTPTVLETIPSALQLPQWFCGPSFLRNGALHTHPAIPLMLSFLTQKIQQTNIRAQLSEITTRT